MATIRTDRLSLRPVEPTDLDAIARMMADPEVCRYIGDGRPRTRERVARSVDFAVRLWDERGFGPFLIEFAPGPASGPARASMADSRCVPARPGMLAPSAFVGVCLLVPIARSGTDPADFDARGPEIEIGYWLTRAAWGHGYATEAAGAVLRWATGDAGLDRLIAVTLPANEASKRVLVKIGMHPVGETDAFYDTTTVLYEYRPGSAARCAARSAARSADGRMG